MGDNSANLSRYRVIKGFGLSFGRGGQWWLRDQQRGLIIGKFSDKETAVRRMHELAARDSRENLMAASRRPNAWQLAARGDR